MKSRVVAILLCVVCTLGCSSARQWRDLAVHDVKELATAPKRATAAQWKSAAVVAGAVLASTALDERARDVARRNQSDAADNVAEIVEPLGGRYADRVLAGFLLTGLVTRDRKTQAVAFDGIGHQDSQMALISRRVGWLQAATHAWHDNLWLSRDR